MPDGDSVSAGDDSRTLCHVERVESVDESLSPPQSVGRMLSKFSRSRRPSEVSNMSDLKREIALGGLGSSHALEGEDDSVLDKLGVLVRKPKFELTIAGLIMLNALIMSFETQYRSFDIGHDLGYRWHQHPADEVWGDATAAFLVIDYVFGVCYLLELTVKILGFGWGWFLDPWHYFDFAIVALWVIERPLAGTLPLDTAIMRMARLFRLFRLVKVMKALHGFDSLYLLTTTLKGSSAVLGWSCVLLLTVQMFIAMLCWFLLTEVYFNNENYPLEERLLVFEYFGSFTRSMLTMFEMTLANWPPVCRLLVEYVNEWFMLFCIIHKLTIGFAVIGVINGVFMQETFRVASTDDRIMVREREREVKAYTQKMKRLFAAADDSGDGFLDLEEFKTIMADPNILFWLSSMQISVQDPEKLYRILDVDGDQELTCEEVVAGFMKMRGAAKSMDLILLKKDLEDLKKILVPGGSRPSSPSDDHSSGENSEADGREDCNAKGLATGPPAHPFEVSDYY
jgi:voltage-gated sodium channel